MGAVYSAYSRLLELRKAKLKTIAEMSADTGISASAISNYERGLRSPDADTLIKLSNYFKCTTDYLLGLSDFKNEKRIEYSNLILADTAKLLAELDHSNSDLLLLELNEMLQNSVDLKEYWIKYNIEYLVDDFLQLDILQNTNKMKTCFDKIMLAETNDIDKLCIFFLTRYETAVSSLREYKSFLMSVLLNHAKNSSYIRTELKKMNPRHAYDIGD